MLPVGMMNRHDHRRRYTILLNADVITDFDVFFDDFKCDFNENMGINCISNVECKPTIVLFCRQSYTVSKTLQHYINDWEVDVKRTQTDSKRAVEQLVLNYIMQHFVEPASRGTGAVAATNGSNTSSSTSNISSSSSSSRYGMSPFRSPLKRSRLLSSSIRTAHSPYKSSTPSSVFRSTSRYSDHYVVVFEEETKWKCEDTLGAGAGGDEVRHASDGAGREEGEEDYWSEVRAGMAAANRRRDAAYTLQLVVTQVQPMAYKSAGTGAGAGAGATHLDPVLRLLDSTAFLLPLEVAAARGIPPTSPAAQHAAVPEDRDAHSAYSTPQKVPHAHSRLDLSAVLSSLPPTLHSILGICSSSCIVRRCVRCSAGAVGADGDGEGGGGAGAGVKYLRCDLLQRIAHEVPTLVLGACLMEPKATTGSSCPVYTACQLLSNRATDRDRAFSCLAAANTLTCMPCSGVASGGRKGRGGGSPSSNATSASTTSSSVASSPRGPFMENPHKSKVGTSTSTSTSTGVAPWGLSASFSMPTTPLRIQHPVAGGRSSMRSVGALDRGVGTSARQSCQEDDDSECDVHGGSGSGSGSGSSPMPAQACLPSGNLHTLQQALRHLSPASNAPLEVHLNVAVEHVRQHISCPYCNPTGSNTTSGVQQSIASCFTECSRCSAFHCPRSILDCTVRTERIFRTFCPLCCVGCGSRGELIDHYQRCSNYTKGPCSSVSAGDPYRLRCSSFHHTSPGNGRKGAANEQGQHGKAQQCEVFLLDAEHARDHWAEKHQNSSLAPSIGHSEVFVASYFYNLYDLLQG